MNQSIFVWLKSYKKRLSRQHLMAIVFILSFIVLGTLGIEFFKYIQKKHDFESLNRVRAQVNQNLADNWRHYVNHENFEGDWWSQKFKHPKMILDDGRPLAFPDGGDADNDGIKDIDWSHPEKPFEYIVVSEASSYAMLRAVWMNDKKTFDKVWKWTYHNLQRCHIKSFYYWKDINSPENKWTTPEEMNVASDHLFAWRWIPTIASQNNGVGKQDGVIFYRWQPPSKENNPNVPWRDGWDNAADADSDIALALVFADSRWGSYKKGKAEDHPLNYQWQAKAILNDLWDKNTQVYHGVRYMMGGNNMKSIEPGYLSPASYRIFDDFDTKHDWMQLVPSSYRIFRDAAKIPLNTLVIDGKKYANDPSGRRPAPNLLPDWVDVRENGTLTDGTIRNEPEFGNDVFRALWRMSIDSLWFEKEAKPFTKEVVLKSGKYSPLKYFEWRLKNPPKEFSNKNSKYDLNGKLSSLFWHNGDVAYFDTIWTQFQEGYRANAGEYALYMCNAYAGEDYKLAAKLLEPLITPEMNGFSKRQYIIPDDAVANSSLEDLAKNTPKNKIDKRNDEAKPFGPGDGWWVKTKDGGYWTLYDHSDWNSQSEYFGTTWTWFGLAAFSGLARNLYQFKPEAQPIIQSIDFYSNPEFTQRITHNILDQTVYIMAKTKSGTAKKDYVRVLIRSSYPKTKHQPFAIKLVETSPTSNCFVGSIKINLIQNAANAEVAAPKGSKITVSSFSFPKVIHSVRVGLVSIKVIIEDFSDGDIHDAYPLAWWTDDSKGISTYALKTMIDVTGDLKSTLKIFKKYQGNDYPYLGGVLFNKTVSDWSQQDDFLVRMYLTKNIGDIRVDLQDSDGTIAILNGYNPWKDEQGPGWYTWKASYPKGADSDRDNIDSGLMSQRHFWKGWSFEKERNTDVTSEFNLASIKNIQFCLGPANATSGELYFKDLAIERTNRFVGHHLPWWIWNVRLFKDADYKTPLRFWERIAQDDIYVQLKGIDGDRWSVDTIPVKVKTSDHHPGCKPIVLYLKETDCNTGVYRAKLHLALASDQSSQTIGSSQGYTVTVSPPTWRFWKKQKRRLDVFDMHTVIDRFDTTDIGSSPASWWTDELNSLEGSPVISPGHQLGYFLWKTADKVWHLRWTSNGVRHQFKGDVYCQQGIDLTNVIRGDQDSRFLIDKGRFIRFSTDEVSANNGFDFTASGTDVRFDLYIDGKHDPERIQIGRFVYKKAYTVPFYLENNTDITKTYALTTSADTSEKIDTLSVSKNYNKKDYPYFGKWGLDKSKARWQSQDSLDFSVYLPSDIGSIRTEIEDTKGNRAILHEYDPWDAQIGAGWYRYSTQFLRGLGVSNGKVQPLPLRDRLWLKGWDMAGEQTMDASNISLNSIINLLVSVGGGVRSNAVVQLGDIELSVKNIHLGYTPPKKIKAISLFTASDYLHEKLKVGDEIKKNIIYIQVKGKDANRYEKDRMFVRVMSSDKHTGCFPIRVPLTETGLHTGIYRGFFTVDLQSDEEHSVIGSARGNAVFVQSMNGKALHAISIGEMMNSYVLDNFDDGSIVDHSPLTWWEDTINPRGEGPVLDPFTDPGIYLFKDHSDIWHLLWYAKSENEDIEGYLQFDKGFSLLSQEFFGSIIRYDVDNKKLLFKGNGEPYKLYQLSFKTDSKAVKLYFTRDKKEIFRDIHIGQEMKFPYILPYILSNENISKNYDISIVTRNTHGGNYAMGVNKQYIDKLYPYFGAWGLKNDQMNFSNKDYISFWVYLPKDPRNIQVDAEDIHGTTTVINSCNPYDPKKGAGWYLWRSDCVKSIAAEEDHVQPGLIKEREWWKGWSVKDQNYYYTTTKFDFRHVQSLQFLIGGGFKENFNAVIDDIRLHKPNYHTGENQPISVKKIEFFRTQQMITPIAPNEFLTQNVVYIKISGEDGNPYELDRFSVTVNTNDPRTIATASVIQFSETQTNSGIYKSKLNFGLFPNSELNIMGVEKGRDIIISYNHCIATLNISKIVVMHTIDDFEDGLITDKTPVTWWTDTLVPFASPNVNTDVMIDQLAKPGYFVWKTPGRWHFRWYAKESEIHFTGEIKGIGGKTKLKRIMVYNFKNSDHVDWSNDQKVVKFDSKVKSGWKGFDFDLDGPLMEFDIKQDGEHWSKYFYVGPTRAPAYIMPVRLHNNKTMGTYTQKLVTSNVLADRKMMLINKKYIGKDYPYFGLWGLRSLKTDWRIMDELFVWMYLPYDVGAVQVDIEDYKGIKGVVNLYQLYDKKQGPGWYRWSSNFFPTQNNYFVDHGVIDPHPIKARHFWEGYEEKADSYVDTTPYFTSSNIVNVQIIADPASARTITFNIHSIGLVEKNYRSGDTTPSRIEGITLYTDPFFSKRFDPRKLLNQKNVYIELLATDRNPNAVDEAFLKMIVTANKYVQIRLSESSSDSGVYRGHVFFRTGFNDIRFAPFEYVDDDLTIVDVKPNRRVILKTFNSVEPIQYTVYLGSFVPEKELVKRNFWPLIIASMLASLTIVAGIFRRYFIKLLRVKRNSKKDSRPARTPSNRKN